MEADNGKMQHLLRINVYKKRAVLDSKKFLVCHSYY